MLFSRIYTPNLVYSCLITDVVNSYFDVWIVGDVFLRNIADQYFTMMNEAVAKKKHPPYLFEIYNVATYFNASSSCPQGLARFINPLVEALNE